MYSEPRHKNRKHKRKRTIETRINMELEVGSQSTLYKIGYVEETVGKKVKNSKTRVSWKFACGNRQHLVVLSWSKSSGRQEIRMDDISVWFGRNKGRSVLDHNWITDDDTLKLHVLATCAPKLSPNFRSYDLLINGQLFASLPPHNYFDGYGESGETELMAESEGDASSIIQILFPDGYKPPTYRTQRQPNRRQPVQESSNQNYAIVKAIPTSSNGNGVTYPPVVDLLS